MDLRLTASNVIVTGATRGLGRAITGALVQEGANVVGCGLDAQRMPAGVRRAIEIDLSESGASASVVAMAEMELGGVDVIIAAAGGAFGGRIETCDGDRWSQGISLNLMSVVELRRASIQPLRKSQAGRILLFGAVSGLEPPASNGIANVTKAGVHALTKTLSREVGRDGILVNCIAAGRIRSEQVDHLFPDEESRRDYSAGRIPLGRFGESEEVVPMALLLVSPVNTYVTGQTISVDGGFSSAT